MASSIIAITVKWIVDASEFLYKFIQELSAELGLPCHTFGLYRPPTPGPGKTWPTT